MSKECLCTTCSFASVCEYRSTTKKHCIDHNDAISHLYSQEALRARLKSDRQTELGMAIGFLGFLVVIALCIIGKEVITPDGWLLSVAWPAVWNFVKPLISIVLNGFVAIVHLAMVLIMTAGAVLLVVWFARSIHVIGINIQRKIGGKHNA
ncbi:MAG: hypothetical protein IJZ68_08590 [Bacteroidaceae bacterium]|nr:hypothetical protein [Bacteroidaceae bacterium]